MTSSLFQSFARNGEDVVLWRALGGVAPGAVIEVTSSLEEYSATEALLERGWTRLLVREPDTAGTGTPQDGDDPAEAVRAGLSAAERTAAGLDSRQLHALVLPAGQLAGPVLSTLTEAGLKPWVIVLSQADLPVHEAQTAATRLEQESGYELCLFDGVSAYYVHPEHAEQLRPTLSYPAGARDLYDSPRVRALEAARAELAEQLTRTSQTVIQWRAAALQRWDAAAVGGLANHAYGELEAMRNTVSWKVTRPLRAVRRRVALPGSGG